MDCIGFSDFSYVRNGSRVADAFNDADEFQEPPVAASSTQEDGDWSMPPVEDSWDGTNPFEEPPAPDDALKIDTFRPSESVEAWYSTGEFEEPPPADGGDDPLKADTFLPSESAELWYSSGEFAEPPEA